MLEHVCVMCVAKCGFRLVRLEVARTLIGWQWLPQWVPLFSTQSDPDMTELGAWADPLMAGFGSGPRL